MPVILPSGETVHLGDGRAQRHLRLRRGNPQVPPLRVTCGSCSPVAINGCLCHERGCPEAWRDSSRECRACGQAFRPDRGNQDCCDADCNAAYRG